LKKIRFYAQDQLDELYRQMKKTRYEDREPWEKFLNDSASAYFKKQKKIFEHEVSVEYIPK
jgi:hypothetical protein